MLLVGSFLFSAGCIYVTPRPVSPARSTASAEQAAEGAFDDDPRPPTASESAVISAGLDPEKLAAVERNLLGVMLNPSSRPAELQDAAQQLSLTLLAAPSKSPSPTLAAVGSMLADPARTEYARLALDRVPGLQVDAFYLQALSATNGRAGLGIIDSIGARTIGDAVPALAVLLNDTDRATAAAAARALGQIGGSAALEALSKSEHPLDPIVLNARLTAAATTDPLTAATVSSEIYRNPSAPLPQRTAALRSLIAANPADAVEEIHTVLSGTEPAFHAVVIESVSTLPAAASFASRLAEYTPAVQVPFITALGFRGDPAAVPGLIAALANPDEGVRLAAIDALGRLPGSSEVATRLAALAVGKDETAKKAFASLARLDGPEMDEFVLASARTEAEVARRVVFIQQLAARNQTAAISFLFGLRSSSEEAVRLEALDTLRGIAAFADQPPIIAWALAAPSKAEQSRAVRALISIILREDDASRRADTVIAAIKLGDPAARLTLLPILSRVGGPSALACAGSLALDTDETVAQVATAELARWPDVTALPVLGDVAVRSTVEPIRVAATQGAIRFLNQNTVSSADRSTHARALLELPLNLPARRELINVLSLCEDQPALDTAKRFLADPATADVAQDAADAITSNLAGAPIFAVSNSPESATRAHDGKLRTYWMVPIVPGEWIRADLHNSRPIRKITLEQGGREWDFPASIDIFVSEDPDQPGEVRAQAEGARYRTIVTLPAGTRGRYLLIRQTGTRSGPWAVAELQVE
jgi:HEAT repeat protein